MCKAKILTNENNLGTTVEKSHPTAPKVINLNIVNFDKITTQIKSSS